MKKLIISSDSNQAGIPDKQNGGLTGMLNKIEITKAESWVDFKPIQPTYGGTLNVTLEIKGDGKKVTLEKLYDKDGLLTLEIRVGTDSKFIPNPQIISYKENLPKDKHYEAIAIETILGVITDITETH